MARSKITEHPIEVAKQAGQGIGRGWSWIWSPFPLTGLTDDEKKVLQMLAAADGNVVWFKAIQHELGSSRLKTEHTITMLRSRDLIEWFSDFQYGGSAALTPFGKAACVNYGWAK